MNNFPHIRRRPDGSFDTDHYVQEARVRRSAAAHEIVGAAMRSSCRPAPGFAALVACVPFLGPAEPH